MSARLRPNRKMVPRLPLVVPAFLCLLVFTNGMGLPSGFNLPADIAAAIEAELAQTAQPNADVGQTIGAVNQPSAPLVIPEEAPDTNPTETSDPPTDNQEVPPSFGNTVESGETPFGSTVFIANADKGDHTDKLSDDAALSVGELNITIQELKQQFLNIGDCDCAAIDPAVQNQNDLATLTSTFNGFRTTCSGLSTTFNSLTSSVTQLTESVSSIDISADLANIETKTAEYKAKVDELETDINNFAQSGVGEDEINQVRTDIDTLTTTVSGLNEQLSSWNSHHSSATSSVDNGITGEQKEALQTSLSSVEERMSSIERFSPTATMTTIETTIESIDTTIASCHEALSSTTATLDGLAAKKANVQSALDELETSVTKFTSESATLQTSVAGMKEALQNVQNDNSGSNAAAEFATEKDSLESDIADARNQRTMVDSTADATSHDIQDLRETVGEMQASLEELQQGSDGISSEFSTITGTVNDLQGQLSDLDVSAEISDFKSSVSQNGERITDLENALSPPHCPYPFAYSYSVNLCYYFNKIKKDWYSAFSACKAIGGKTARLIALDNDAKLYHIADELYYDWDTDSYLVGLYTSYVDYWGYPSFQWPGGSVPSYHLWQSDQPDGYGIMCGNLWVGNSWWYEYHMLDDVPCSTSMAKSICEIPME